MKDDRKRTAPAVENVPQSIECDARLAEMLKRRTEDLARRQEEINSLVESRDLYEKKSLEKIFDYFESQRTYLCANQRTLVGDKKSGVLPGGGSFAWYLGGPAVVVRGKIKKILDELRKKRLRKFIRIKETIDKEAILKEPEKIADVAGLRVRPAEPMFSYQPRGRNEVIRYNEATGETLLEIPKVERKSEEDE